MQKNSLKTILSHLPGHIRAPLTRAAPLFENDAREIILRARLPIVIECRKRLYLTENGSVTTTYHSNHLLKTTRDDIQIVFKSICDYSVYARQNELNQGYITIKDGVRVGVSGTAVIGENGVSNIKDITTLSFRVAGEVIGCADRLLQLTDPTDGVLICGPPCSGKTTIIRDLARRLSESYKVSVIDERNEISATTSGERAYDLCLCDVLVGMKKGGGVIRALRGLSPDIIVCDELGDREDIETLRQALRCGAAFIATVHARNIDDLRCRDMTAELLSVGAFRYIVILRGRDHAGKIGAVYEWRGSDREAALIDDGHRGVLVDRQLSCRAAE